MRSYTLSDLNEWNDAIEVLVNASGLNCYEQHFEICNYEDMLCYEAYVGMPSHYPHWSYGKTYEKQKSYYQYNLVGLPYEMVINSDPCIAYLMRDNTLLLQVLTMAHVYGHNDFFKNNRLFKRDTRAELTVEMFKTHANRVRQYIEDPGIGPEKVERILDAAHALRFQIPRYGAANKTSRREVSVDPRNFNEDLLGFLYEAAQLEEWERDLIRIVREESLYFIPQIETKIMNEGWASYWHYQLLKQLNLPQDMHLEFLQRHNMVVCPHSNRINPYFLGFKIFEYLAAQTNGLQNIMTIRETERDESFIRRYLNFELCQALHLFAHKPVDEYIVVSEVADDKGWRVIRDKLASSVGLGSIPVITPRSVEKGTLVLEHIYDGRELELNYAKESIKYIASIWGARVELLTTLQNKPKVITCSETKDISVRDRAPS